MNSKDVTIVICCAGMGRRLGIGTSKALLDIGGKPLILRQLDLLKDYDDIRIVVGYDAEKVINTVLSYRKDVMFVFNYQYETTSVVTSMRKALLNPRKYIVEIDGDVLINPVDLVKLLDYPGECIGGNSVQAVNSIGLDLKDGKVLDFKSEGCDYEWTGLAKIDSRRELKEEEFLYIALKPFLPIDFIYINSRDIDTVEDYEKALVWFNEGYRENNQ